MNQVAENFKRNLKLKPNAKMIGEDGNIFNLIGIARKALRHMPEAYNEMRDRIYCAHSYDEALAILNEYVNII